MTSSYVFYCYVTDINFEDNVSIRVCNKKYINDIMLVPLNVFFNLMFLIPFNLLLDIRPVRTHRHNTHKRRIN